MDIGEFDNARLIVPSNDYVSPFTLSRKPYIHRWISFFDDNAIRLNKPHHAGRLFNRPLEPHQTAFLNLSLHGDISISRR